MTESEVADRYRSRFAAAVEQTARVRRVLAEGTARLEHRESAWLALALVPNTSGEMEIRHRTVKNVMSWAYSKQNLMPSPAAMTRNYQARAGVGRVVLVGGVDQDTGLSSYGHLELFKDGSAFVADVVGWMPTNTQGQGSQAVHIYDENLVGLLASLLGMAALHAAENTRTESEAAVAAAIAHAGPSIPTFLYSTRGYGSGSPLHGTHALSAAVITEHSVSIDALNGSTIELLGGAYLLLSDLVQAFGLPEPLQLTARGEIRRRYYGHDMQQQVSQWAERNGVPIVDSTVETET